MPRSTARAAIIADLATLVPSALVWHHAYGLLGDEARIRATQVHPETGALAAWAMGHDGAAIHELMDGLPASACASSARFEVLTRDDVAGTAIEEVWRAHDIGACASTHLVADGRVVAWVGVLRRTDDPPFSGKELAALDARREDLTRRLAAVARAEQPPADGPVAFLVEADGAIVATSDHARTWLSLPGFTATLSDWVRRLPPGTSRAERAFTQGLAQAVRVGGAEGHAAFAVTLRPYAPARASALLGLSPIQRRIAELAASGASNTEIAWDLHRSVETVRTHLAKAYGALGISNRVELARRFDEIAWLVPDRSVRSSS